MKKKNGPFFSPTSNHCEADGGASLQTALHIPIESLALRALVLGEGSLLWRAFFRLILCHRWLSGLVHIQERVLNQRFREKIVVSDALVGSSS